MKNSLQKIWNSLQKIVRHKHFGIGMVLVLLLLPTVVLAADPQQAPTTNTSVNEMFKNIVNVLVIAMTFIKKLIWPILLLIGSLLKNDILFGGGMEERILQIWYVIRNFVNILMVLVLLGIALYNVAGGKAQDYHLKAILPKFVIALVAVNFSYALLKIAVDAVNVFTTVIFALPSSVEEGFGQGIDKIFAGQGNYEERICKDIYGQDKSEYTKNIEEAKKSSGGGSTKDGFTFCKADSYTLTDEAKVFFSKFDGYNAGIILAVNMMKMDNLDKVKTIQPDLKSLTVNIVFSAFLYIIYGAAFLALFCILLVRLVVVWLGLVLSPLIVLPSVLPESIKGSLGGGDTSKKVIQNIIAPIPVAVVMTLGFILLTGLQKSTFTGVLPNTGSGSVGLLLSGYSTLQELIVAVGTIAFLWVGIFKAAEGTAAEKLVGGIKGAVEGAGKFALSAIKYAPIFPVQIGQQGAGEKPTMMSLGALSSAAKKLPYAMERKGEEQGEVLLKGVENARLSQAKNLVNGASSGKELQQALGAAGSGMTKEPGQHTMRDLGEKLHQNPAWRKDFDWTVKVRSKDGKTTYDTQDKLIDAMRKGQELNEEDFEKWRQKNMLEPPKIEAGKAQGKPGDKSAYDPAMASSLIGATGTYAGALNDKEKKAVDTFQKAKDDKAKQKAAESADFQSAMGKLKSLNDSDIAWNLGGVNTGADLDKKIDDRKAELEKQFKDAGNKNAAAEAEKVLANEIAGMSADKQGLIDQSPKAKAYQDKGKAAKAAAPAPKPAASGGPAAGGGGTKAPAPAAVPKPVAGSAESSPIGTPLKYEADGWATTPLYGGRVKKGEKFFGTDGKWHIAQ